MTEHALFVARVSNLKYWDPVFTRLYYGIEFCERLLPTASELQDAAAFAKEKKVGFSFVTPYVTEAGLRRLERLLAKLDEAAPGSEVIFNDFGVLRVLRSRFGGFTPVMGRLLNKMKRGPRLMMVIDRLPDTTVEYFRNSSLTVPRFRSYLNSQGVHRVELDNLLQGIDLPIPGMDVFLYVPYAYVTTTRLCLMNAADVPGQEKKVGVFPCKRECRKYTVGFSSEIMPVPLIRKGNTIFFENPALPEDLEGSGISRLVLQPEPPL